MCFFNNHRWCATILTSLSVMLITYCAETFALPTTATGTNHLPGCGDYSILNNSSDRIELEKHCASKEDVDLMAMIKTIDRLSPENEARSAAKRGDFRLAALIGGGPPRPGQDRFWFAASLKCNSLDISDVAILFHMTDGFRSPTHGRLQNRFLTYAEKYNTALRVQEGFPATLGCN